MKIKKCEKLACNFYVKKVQVVHIRTLKQALNRRLILQKLDWAIKFNQQAWLKPYMVMNAKLRPKEKMILKIIFWKLESNAVFVRPWKIRESRDFKLVTNEKRRNCFMSEPNYHTAKCFSVNLSAIEIKKKKKKKKQPGVNLFI